MKLLAAVAGVILFGTAILLAVILTRPASRHAAAPAPREAPVPGPAAVVFARQLGSEALALGIVPQSGKVLLQASVLDTQGSRVRGLAVAFTAGRAFERTTPCGAGCYRATLETPQRPRTVEIEVRGGPMATRWRVPLPSAWPPRDASALVAGALLPGGHCVRSRSERISPPTAVTRSRASGGRRHPIGSPTR